MIEGYHFESESIAGDFWLTGGLAAQAFLDEVERATGTFPEIVSAYVDGGGYASMAEQIDGYSPAPLGSDLPVYEAPDATPR